MDSMNDTGDRRLLGSGFPHDSGQASPEVADALAAYAEDSTRYTEALAVLVGARLLVPVVAMLGEMEHDAAGLAHDKSSEMAAVLLTGADGRIALLAFTGTDALAAWDPQARPVPVTTATAAKSAVQEGAAALVVDVAGPVTLVIEGEDLLGLAAAWTLARVGGRDAWIATVEMDAD